MLRFHLNSKLILTGLMLLWASLQLQAQEKVVDRIGERIAVINDGYYRVLGINTGEGIVVIDTHVSEEDMLECKELLSSQFGTDTFIHTIYSHGCLEHVLGFSALPETRHVAHIGIEDSRQFFLDALPDIDSLIQLNESKLAGLDSSQEEFKRVKTDLEGLHWRKKSILSYRNLQPDILFTDRLSLNFKELTLELIFSGLGHGHSIFVHIPEEDFLFVSTLSPNQPYPFWVLKHESDFIDIEKSLITLTELIDSTDSLDYIVPGHGPYLTHKELSDIRDYHSIMYTKTHKAQLDGKTLEEAKTTLTLEKLFPEYEFSRNPKEDAHEIQLENIELMWRYIEGM